MKISFICAWHKFAFFIGEKSTLHFELARKFRVT